MKTMKAKFFTIIMCAVVMAFSALADAKSDARARRKARRDKVATLVSSGDASEGVNGYLVPKKALGKDERTVVNAENSDRKIGYTAIAKENKTSVETVSKAAGKINRKKSARKKR